MDRNRLRHSRGGPQSTSFRPAPQPQQPSRTSGLRAGDTAQHVPSVAVPPAFAGSAVRATTSNMTATHLASSGVQGFTASHQQLRTTITGIQVRSTLCSCCMFAFSRPGISLTISDLKNVGVNRRSQRDYRPNLAESIYPLGSSRARAQTSFLLRISLAVTRLPAQTLSRASSCDPRCWSFSSTDSSSSAQS